MKKGDILNGYKILQDFIVAGGQSKISYAEKDGRNYFIKEFLTPKYPISGSPGSEKTKTRKRNKCRQFEDHHNKINTLIAERCGLGGNLVYALDFFRNGTTYYKINERIDVSSFDPKSISKLDIKDILLICKTVCHSLRILHSLNIIHGDLKPDNVLIKKTKTNKYTSKLIDFDNSFFEHSPPLNKEEIVGDQVYFSPELAKYIVGDESATEKSLTTKSDIFSLGILFYEYLTGKTPKFDSKYSYLWQSCSLTHPIEISSPHIPSDLSDLIESMLLFDYSMRPNVGSIFDTLKAIDSGKSVSFRPRTSPSKGVLKGSLVKKARISDSLKDSSSSKLKGSLIKKKRK